MSPRRAKKLSAPPPQRATAVGSSPPPAVTPCGGDSLRDRASGTPALGRDDAWPSSASPSTHRFTQSREVSMYHHVKKLMYTVRVGAPDPTFGKMLLEQFGGATGDLAAAMQYSIQGRNCDDLERKDLLMDIGTEELSHLEIVGALARLHLKPMKFNRENAEADPLIAIAGGGGVSLYNSMGHAWTADYLKITGELDVDLRSNIAAEARAKIVYERLMNFTDDAGTKDALQFLMTREITHMKAFTAALESMGKPRFAIGKIPPTAMLVDQFFNDSTGDGDDGEFDARGPWNEGDQWVIVEAPAFQHLGKERKDAVSIDGRGTSTAAHPQRLQDLRLCSCRG